PARTQQPGEEDELRATRQVLSLDGLRPSATSGAFAQTQGGALRKHDGERAPAIGLRAQLETPPERSHHLLHEREPQPDAGSVLVAYRLELLERLEDAALICDRDARPGVLDREPEAPRGVRHGHAHAAALGVLDAV